MSGGTAKAETKQTRQRRDNKDDYEISSPGTQKNNDLHRDQENLEKLRVKNKSKNKKLMNLAIAIFGLRLW